MTANIIIAPIATTLISSSSPLWNIRHRNRNIVDKTCDIKLYNSVYCLLSFNILKTFLRDARLQVLSQFSKYFSKLSSDSLKTKFNRTSLGKFNLIFSISCAKSVFRNEGSSFAAFIKCFVCVSVFVKIGFILFCLF